MDNSTCDHCKKVGKRLRRAIAPDGWPYIISPDEESGEQYVTYVCSEECKQAIWRNGPGQVTMKDMLTPTYPSLPMSNPDEILGALEDEIKSENISEVKISVLTGKFFVCMTIEEPTREVYAGIGVTLANAFQEAFEHMRQDRLADPPLKPENSNQKEPQEPKPSNNSEVFYMGGTRNSTT